MFLFEQESIYVPDPVVSMALKYDGKDFSGAMSKALNRFSKEDPTFRVGYDEEAKEVICVFWFIN